MGSPSLFDFEITAPDALLPECCAYRGTEKAASAAHVLVTAAIEVSAPKFETVTGALEFKERVHRGLYRIPEAVHAAYCPEFGD